MAVHVRWWHHHKRGGLYRAEAVENGVKLSSLRCIFSRSSCLMNSKNNHPRVRFLTMGLLTSVPRTDLPLRLSRQTANLALTALAMALSGTSCSETVGEELDAPLVARRLEVGRLDVAAAAHRLGQRVVVDPEHVLPGGRGGRDGRR